MKTGFPIRGVRDTADSCGDPIAQNCQIGTSRDHIWYATPGNPCPTPGYLEVTQNANCSGTVGDITDLDGSPVVGAFLVPAPNPLGTGGFVVGAFCGA